MSNETNSLDFLFGLGGGTLPKPSEGDAEDKQGTGTGTGASADPEHEDHDSSPGTLPGAGSSGAESAGGSPATGNGGAEDSARAEGDEGTDLAAAATAFPSLSPEQLQALLESVKGNTLLPDMQGSDDGDSTDRSWEARDRERRRKDRAKAELAERTEGLVVPVQPLQSGGAGRATSLPISGVGQGHEEGNEGLRSPEAGDYSAGVQGMEVGLHGGYEKPGSEVFFPSPTGEHAGRVQDGLSSAPWEVRRAGVIEHVFPWAEGITEEQREKYEEQVKGVIPRLGAKSKLREWLIPRFPSHHTYIEPFGGSFKVLLWKSKRSKIEIINDLDDDLIHFFRYLTFYPTELASLVNSLPTHQGLLNALRDELKRDQLSGIERAAAVYYSVKLSFNGTGQGYAGSVQSLCSARANPGEFRRVADRLRNVDIRSEDAHGLIDASNRRLDPDNYPGGIFYYLDPPYDETAGYSSLKAKSIYGKQEQWQLFQLAKKIHECGNKFLMTNSYTDYLRNMWCKEPDWFFVSRDVRYEVSRDATTRQETKELIVSNFPLEQRKAETKQTGMF